MTTPSRRTISGTLMTTGVMRAARRDSAAGLGWAPSELLVVLAFDRSSSLDIDPREDLVERVAARRLPFGKAYGLRVENSMRCWSLYHDAYCVTLVRAGQGRWRCRRREAEFVPHGLMMMDPGEIHTILKVTSPCSFHALFFEPALLREIVGIASLGEPRFKWMATAQHGLVNAFQTACSALESGAEPAFQRVLLARALLQLFEQASENALPCRAVATTPARKAARILREHYENAPWQRVDIASVSTELGMSYHWLVHSFTAEYGMAPYQYVQALRLARTRQLLANGPTDAVRTLSDIASAAGFADKSHLHRSVKRALGISPWQLALQLDPRW